MTGGPHVLVYDASPGVGGALTSLAALVDVLVSYGWQVTVAAVCPEAAAACGLRAISVGIRPHLPAWNSGWRLPFREAARAVALNAVARDVGADVILANNAPNTNLAAYVVGAGNGLPLLQYVRCELPRGRLVSAALRRSEWTFAVGDFALRSLPMSVRHSPRTLQVAEGLSETQQPTPRDALASRWFWCSALTPWKGYELLMQAYRETADGRQPLDVCYAPLKTTATRLTAAAGVKHHRLSPFLDRIRADACAYFHTALLPEPFGRSVLEAMSAGLCPVVPCNYTALDIEHQRNGLVYTTGSPSSLSAVMTWMATYPDRVRALGEAARDSVRGYTAHRVFAPVHRALNQAVRGHAPLNSLPNGRFEDRLVTRPTDLMQQLSRTVAPGCVAVSTSNSEESHACLQS